MGHYDKEIDEFDDHSHLLAGMPTRWRDTNQEPGAPRNAGRSWTPHGDQTLGRYLRTHKSIKEIAEIMGRTETAIEIRASTLGLLEQAGTPTIVSKELNVNHMHLITLLQEGYTTCTVTFSDSRPNQYTYKVPKDAGIVPGNHVVVYAGTQLKVGRVMEVHTEPQIDFNAPYALKWVVQKVDTAKYDEHAVREAAALDQLTKLQRKKDQEQMLNTLFGGQEGLEDLKRLVNGG